MYGKKPPGYLDSASLLITILLELVALFRLPDLYHQSRIQFQEEPSLQTAYFSPGSEIEELLFIQNVDSKYWIESDISLPENIDDFRQAIMQKIKPFQSFRTDQSGYGFLRDLAQSSFGNEPHPNEWRSLLTDQK